MLLKVCKVRDPEDIARLCELPVGYLGFDFRSTSPHYLGEVDESLLSTIPERIKKVGVFDNEEVLYITYIAGRFSLSGVQIEGDVPPKTCEILAAEGLEIIKVIHSLSEVVKYEGVCNKFLVRDAELLAKYNSKTALIVDAELWTKGCGNQVDMGLSFEKSVALKNLDKIEDWIEANF